MSFCERLKERREMLRMSRSDLAKLLDVVPSAVANYENGVSHPKLEILYKLFEVLQVDANYLYQDEYMANPDPETVYLTSHEKKVVTAYRDQPEMQPAVDRILGVPSEEE